MNILEFVMGVDSKPFVTGVDRGKAALNEFKHQAVDLGEMTKLGDALKVLGVSFAAFKSIEGIGEGFKSIFEQGKALRAENKATGESITDLITLQKAYKEVGLDPSGLQQNLTMLQAALGGVNAEGEPTKVIFDQLGLSLDRLKGEDAVTQFKEIGTAISSLATQSDKIAAVRAIFGRQGANMINILSDPKAIEEAAKSTAEKAAVYEKNAALFTRVTNEFEAIGVKTQGFFLGAAEAAAHTLEPALEEIKKIDTIKIGEKVGTGLGNAVANFRKDFAESIDQVAGLTVSLLAIGFSPSILKPLAVELTSIASKFGDQIRRAITGAKEGETSQQTIDKGGIWGGVERVWTGAQSGIQTGIESLMETLGEIESHRVHINPDGSERPETDAEFRVSGAYDLRNFHPGSYSENLRQIRGSSVEQQGDESRKELGNPAKVLAEELKKQISQVFASSSLFKGSMIAHSPEEEDRASTLKKFSLAGVNVKGDSSRHGAKEQSSDRLAKIGGLIGGGGPAAEHARRTADATVDLRNLLKSAIQSGIKIIAPPVGTATSDAIA